MNFGEWRARLVENPGMIGVDLWLFQDVGRTRYVLNHKGERVEVKEATAVDYDNYFARFEDTDALRAIADAFANYGVKTANDHKNEGLLEAKDAHLQDMRRLVFRADDPVSDLAKQSLADSTDVTNPPNLSPQGNNEGGK